MTLLVHPHAPAADGVVIDITPESAGWGHVGFRVVKLAAGQAHAAARPGARRASCR